MISRFAQGEHAQFAYAVIALIAAAALLALALLVPQSVFDVVLGDPALASNISRTIIDWMGGVDSCSCDDRHHELVRRSDSSQNSLCNRSR